MAEARVKSEAQGSVIGIDLGGTKLMAGLFDAAGELVERHHVKVAGLSTGELLEALARAVSELRSSASGRGDRVEAAGYGVPTTIDQRSGRAVVAANLPIKDVALRDELVERTGLMTLLDNDANVAALAEQRLGAGAASGAQHLIMVTLGTGFGGGIVIDGQIFRGSIGAGGELGHMSIDRDGPPCVAPNCPGIGCIETFCSGSALARDVAAFVAANPESAIAAEVAMGEPARGELIVRMAAQHDADAIGLLEAMGRNLGVALANLTNIFNPEMFCLGGGLLAAQQWVLPVAEQTVRQLALPPSNALVRLEPAHFGADAGMIGAALLARDGVNDRVTGL